ncbi:TPA: helix-turn-helix domain-containing protein, partial [Escherichia coli]
MLVTKLAEVRLDSKYLIWSVALQWSKLHIQCMKKSLRIQFGERVKELRIATGLS